MSEEVVLFRTDPGAYVVSRLKVFSTVRILKKITLLEKRVFFF